ncbi:MAG: aryl-sulfate sulfotransferase [Phycisphaerae bacterium]|nr:aryl-sulfate sulfotransferase [Phycisphaerae bacterium]
MNTYRSLISAIVVLVVLGSASAAEPEGRSDRNNRQGHRNNQSSRGGRGGQGGGRQSNQSQGDQFVKRQIGLITNTPQAWPGYTLFAPKHNLLTYLIDNEGQIFNTWTSSYEPGQSVYLLENDHLLHCCLVKGVGSIGGGEGGRLEEYDWNGNLIWEYWCTDNNKMMHHDIEPLPNGNFLAMIVERKTYDECMAAGFPPNTLRDDYLAPEYIAEIKRVGKNEAEIVWQWHVWDHLIQDNDPQKPNYGNPADHPEKISVEVNGRNAPAFWNHMNSIYYNADLDQIMLSVRGCGELWIIDHSTTTEEAKGYTGGRSGKGGGLLYRWGNPSAYGRGTARDQMLFQQHDAQWVPKGCPGEGNILIFNNGLNRTSSVEERQARGGRLQGGRNRGESYSSIDEIVPPVDSKGNYTLVKGKAFGPEKLKWTYTAPNKTDLYAEAISGCQRLPNGNTLICDGTAGVFFEVTPEGKKTWEYVNPVDGKKPLEQGDPIAIDERGHPMNAVFKIHRYPLDYAAFKGKDMTSQGKIPGSKPENVPENLSRGRRSGGGQRNQGGNTGRQQGQPYLDGGNLRQQGQGGQRERGQRGQQGQRGPDGGNRNARPAEASVSEFTVSSPVVKNGGSLPADFTGDGSGVSMPVSWSGVPTGTKSLALSLWHKAPDQEKSYWVVYNIPPQVNSLPKDVQNIGTVGYNDQNRAQYKPMMSKGGGVKEYNITVFALSAEPTFTTNKVMRADLLKAIEGITLAQNTLTYTYERPKTENTQDGGKQI